MNSLQIHSNFNFFSNSNTETNVSAFMSEMKEERLISDLSMGATSEYLLIKDLSNSTSP